MRRMPEVGDLVWAQMQNLSLEFYAVLDRHERSWTLRLAIGKSLRRFPTPMSFQWRGFNWGDGIENVAVRSFAGPVVLTGRVL
jgi:hypothetical protein